MYQSLEDHKEITNIVTLPYIPDKTIAALYPYRQNRDFVEALRDQSAVIDLHTPVYIDQYLVGNKVHRYLFLKHLQSSVLLTTNVIFFTRYYAPGNTHFLWKENLNEPENVTFRNGATKSVEKQLSKCFSRAHKAKVKQLTSLVMEDKLSPAQFRSIYNELTGNSSVTDNIKSKDVDVRIPTIIKTVDAGILRDLRVNNSLKAKFDSFWDLTSKKVEALQALAVNDNVTPKR